MSVPLLVVGELIADSVEYMVQAHVADALLCMNGAGENLAWSAADFENFLEPRPDVRATMESELEPIVELLAELVLEPRFDAGDFERLQQFLSLEEGVR